MENLIIIFTLVFILYYLTRPLSKNEKKTFENKENWRGGFQKNFSRKKNKKYKHFFVLIDLDVSALNDIKHCIFGKGRLAQLVEHLVYTEGVKGSSPLLPTKIKSGGVAQLVRAIACHAIGRGFESLHSRHFSMIF